MVVNFSTEVYLVNFNYWARPIVVTPLASAPGAPAYNSRGIYDTNETDVIGLDGSNIISDQRTELDVLESEFIGIGMSTPIQGDQIDIPAVDGLPAAGLFEVVDFSNNGGGEVTLIIRKFGPAAP
jgi:hypothetical protein